MGRMVRAWRIGLAGLGGAAALCVLLTGPAAAQVAVIDEAENRITIAAGRGQLLRFGWPVESVFVGDPAVADVQVASPSLVYIFGKAVGATNLFAVAAGAEVAASMSVNVVRDPAAAEEALGAAAPGSAVDLVFAGDRLIAGGTVRDVEEAVSVATVNRDMSPGEDRSLNLTRFPGPQQVNLRVRFAEVSRNDIFRLGINWNALISVSEDVVIGFATGSFVAGAVGNPAETFGSGSLGINAGGFDVNLLIDALQREGVLTILAEPNLTAVTGETAWFLAGGEIPIPVPQGDNAVTIAFKPFGVSLDFTPTLLPDDRIGIRLRPEVSQLTSNGAVSVSGFAIPALVVRRAETTVEVASGQTFAIAGLLQRSITDDVDKLPFLGDIPILGALFRSVRYQRQETELVILITPYLVEPSSRAGAALPTDPRAQSREGTIVAPQRSSLPAEGLAGFIIN